MRKIALVELASLRKVNIYVLIKMARGIPILAGILKKHGYDVTSFVESIQKFDWKELFEYPVIGFSIITCTASPTYKMIRRLRQAGYKGKIVLGGPHATALPEEGILAGADYVVRNEGDAVLVELLEAIAEDRLPVDILGVSFWQKGWIVHNLSRPCLNEEELSELPIPAFETIRGFERMRQIPLNFSRGCPFRCKFCAVAATFGPQYRSICVEKRLGMLRYIKVNFPKLWARVLFFFTDDNFYGNRRTKKIATSFMQEMIEQDLVPPRGCMCQARVADITPEIAKLMWEAGFRYVCFGIESANPETLKEYNKGQTAVQSRAGVRNAREVGMKVVAMMIIGADTETFRSAWRSIKIVRSWDISFLQLLAITPLPGTVLTQELEAENRILSYDYDKYNGHYVLVWPKKMGPLRVWLAMWSINFWFYFLTPNGWRLMTEYLKGGEFVKMVLMVIGHWLRHWVKRFFKPSVVIANNRPRV